MNKYCQDTQSVFRYNERGANSYSCKFLLASNSSYFKEKDIYMCIYVIREKVVYKRTCNMNYSSKTLRSKYGCNIDIYREKIEFFSY